MVKYLALYIFFQSQFFAQNKQLYINTERFEKANNENSIDIWLDRLILFGDKPAFTLSKEDKKNTLEYLKLFSRSFVKKNNNDINEYVIIDISSQKPNLRYLDSLKLNFEYQTSQIKSKIELGKLFENNSFFKLLDSGKGLYKDKYEYIFLKTFQKVNDKERFFFQYLIDINNYYWHIVINTKDGLELDDVIIIN